MNRIVLQKERTLKMFIINIHSFMDNIPTHMIYLDLNNGTL